MDKDGPTDVLAFPMDELRPGLVDEEPEEGVLGDLVLCPEIAATQGETAGHGRDAEIELLTVHGILHLLGYDHAEPEEHREMFGLQDQLLAAWRQPGTGPASPTRTPTHDRERSGLLVRQPPWSCSPGVFTAADAALGGFSRARAEELVAEGRAGSKRLLAAAGRRRPATSTPRCCCDCSARSPRSCWSPCRSHEAVNGTWWASVLATIGVMLVVSFVVVGVAPRTLGRQHSETVALWSRGAAACGHPGARARCRSC